MAGGNTRYEPLDVDDGVHVRAPPPQRSVFLSPRTRADWAFVGGNIGLFLVSLLLWAAGGRGRLSEWECAKVVSPYSPVFPVVEFWEDHFVNYFAHKTIYRGPPTLEREMAWSDLWFHQGVGVSTEGLMKLNKTDFDQYLQTNRSTPENPEYYALIEMFHQLHCLNVLRQSTWPMDLYDPSWDEDLQPMNLSDPVSRTHVDHCVETLRLSLMCYGDVTPMLLLTPDGTLNSSIADFDVHHKCRDFESIRDFVDNFPVDPLHE